MTRNWVAPLIKLTLPDFVLGAPLADWPDFQSPEDDSGLVPSPGAVATGAEIADCVSMLSTEEKQFLYWVTSEYFEGAGAIVDAGCFVGGSTVALAAGLAAARQCETWAARARLHSYDMFLADDYMRR